MRTFYSTLERLPLLIVMCCMGALMMGADGCSSDPNVEGAKLDLNNKDYDRALTNIEKALETNALNAEAWQLRGQVYQEMANEEQDLTKHTDMVNEMVASYVKASELMPAEDVAGKENMVSRMRLAWYNEYQRGAVAYSKQDYPGAIQYFNNAADIQPDSSVTYVNLAYAHISNGESDKAIGPLEMAIEKGDNNPDSYNYLADLYGENDRTDDAIALLEKARTVFPGNEDVMARLFNVYVRNGRADEAIALASSEVEANPEDTRLRYNYGSLLLQAERFDDAIAQLQKAVEIDPNYTSAVFNLGAAHQNKAVAVNSMISEKEDALRADDVSEEDQAKLQEEIDGLVKERDDLFAASLPYLESARQQSEAAGDDVSDICTALGQAYARTNQMDKAEEAYKCAEGGGN